MNNSRDPIQVIKEEQELRKKRDEEFQKALEQRGDKSMLVEVRVVLNVPQAEQDRIPQIVDKVIDTVVYSFPIFNPSAKHSPVTVTIKRMDDDAN